MKAESSGIVCLVGAGPGDPGLLTLRGAELLATADVVVYDNLANPRLLAHCPQARTIYVGKQAARHSMTQERINELLIEEARAGRRVVRLKGGDPFVFGRGGEECEALHAAGIRFEVVPGVTAAIGAPAYAGIPVTHRDLNSSVTFITGHEKEQGLRDADAAAREPGAASDLDWGALARLPCLAFYMGVKSLPRICARLIEHGMDPSMPAATIRGGTTPLQRTVVGTVSDLPERVARAGLAPPALTIIGKTVSLRATLDWFENRPLHGRTIVVTRTRQQAGELSRRLEAAGANIIEAPTVQTAPAADPAKVDEALKSIGRFDWVIFTSVNGVSFVRRRLTELGADARAFGNARIAAIGDATGRAIETELFLKVDLRPERFVAEALADALTAGGHVRGKRFLLLRAEIARPVLVDRLRGDGAAEVSDVAVYETQPASSLPAGLSEALAAGEVRWITFASGSAARNFATLLGTKPPRDVRLASIGPVTTQALEELGLRPTVQAESADLDALVRAITEYEAKHPD